jgi:TRAP-type mannitol/chloroaromatic compound transport system substrate-binding protein
MDESVHREQSNICISSGGARENFRQELERLEKEGFKLEPISEEFVEATVQVTREVLKEKEDEQEDLWWNKFWSWFESFIERFFHWRG